MADLHEDPLGSVARRKLQIIFIADTSGSMSMNGWIQQLNRAAETILPELKEEADRNPQAEVSFRVLEFSSGARWKWAEPLPMNEFGTTWLWIDLEASGVTDLGAALDLLTDELQPDKLGPYNYPPVLVLLSDGAPTDDWESALDRFNASPFGRKPGRTVRAALAVTGADKEVLARFTGNVETVVDVTSPTQLVSFLRWATVTLSKASSLSRAIGSDDDDQSIPQPPPPPPIVSADPDDDIF